MISDPIRRLDFHLEEELPKRFRRWEGHYGGLAGPWIGNPEPPARRMALLVATVLAGALESINPTWTADLDADPESGSPTAVILSAQSGARVDLVPLTFTGRTLTVGNQAVHLAGRRAGERIVELLAARSAAFFARTP